MAQISMTVRMDNQQKAIFDDLCAQFGMSANTAINVFVKTVIRTKSIPFIICADPDDSACLKAINAFNELCKEADTPEMTSDEINDEGQEARQ